MLFVQDSRLLFICKYYVYYMNIPKKLFQRCFCKLLSVKFKLIFLKIVQQKKKQSNN